MQVLYIFYSSYSEVGSIERSGMNAFTILALIFLVGMVCLLGKGGVKTLASIYGMVIGLIPLGIFVLIVALILSLLF